jgi:transposase
MLISTLFSLSADLSLVDVRLEHEGVTLMLRSSQTNAACPACAQPSTHVHGHYTRRLADLPCQKRPVRVCLEVRRFACATRGCPRTTFAERFPLPTRAYARRTLQQAEALTQIAFARGGKAGVQVAKRLAMPPRRDARLAAHPQLRGPQAQDPARAGPRRFRLEKRRSLWDTAP